MATPTNATFGSFEEIDSNLLNKLSQKDLEDLAESLIQGIDDACRDLEKVAIRLYAPDESVVKLKQEGDDLKQRLSILCSNLEPVRDRLTQMMEPMERNALNLEGQRLSDEAAQQQLDRAALAAWNEAERLEEIIRRIEEALRLSATAIEVSKRHFSRLGNPNSVRFKESELRFPERDIKLQGLGAARCASATKKGRVESLRAAPDTNPPFPGSAEVSDLKTHLKKILDPPSVHGAIPSRNHGGGSYKPNDKSTCLLPDRGVYGRAETSISKIRYGTSVLGRPELDGTYINNATGERTGATDHRIQGIGNDTSPQINRNRRGNSE
ncbi:MAG: hypothetical protein CVU57_23540 [Deltaproteobacteria bacterium HGW-Deltaproteobacteria-15]|jgi:regulator of replication initiation timing|nr:MAG: hypothetical protein CVU57_23540 [Deltaproteobacteria bacterium HGW-Deltaproteobacteria-15]